MQNSEILLLNYRKLIQRIEEYNKLYQSKSKLLLVSKHLSRSQIEYIIANGTVKLMEIWPQHNPDRHSQVKNRIKFWYWIKDYKIVGFKKINIKKDEGHTKQT